MNNAIKRSILRCTHLILSIPILGYIYGDPSEMHAVRRRGSLRLRSRDYPFRILDVFRHPLRHRWRCSMAWCLLPGWNWGGHRQRSRAVHHADDLVDDWRATFEVMTPGPSNASNSRSFPGADLSTITFPLRYFAAIELTSGMTNRRLLWQARRHACATIHRRGFIDFYSTAASCSAMRVPACMSRSHSSAVKS